MKPKKRSKRDQPKRPERTRPHTETIRHRSLIEEMMDPYWSWRFMRNAGNQR